MFTIVMFAVANSFVFTVNYMFFTSKSLKGILGANPVSQQFNNIENIIRQDWATVLKEAHTVK